MTNGQRTVASMLAVVAVTLGPAAGTQPMGVPCPWDLDNSGAVDVPDLLTLLAAWGPTGGGCQLADIDLDGTVGVPDLLALLANWG